MSRKFWQIENVVFEGGALRVKLAEMTVDQNHEALPISIAGVIVTGHELKKRANSDRVAICFQNATEFRAIPEQCSWPAYEDGEEIAACLLYSKPGAFFYGKDCPENVECFDRILGWVKADRLKCYVVHSESFDIYVLSDEPPTIE